MILKVDPSLVEPFKLLLLQLGFPVLLCEVYLSFSGLLSFSPSKWVLNRDAGASVHIVVFSNPTSGAGKLILIFPSL